MKGEHFEFMSCAMMSGSVTHGGVVPDRGSQTV